MNQHKIPSYLNKKYLEKDKLENQTNDHVYIQDFLTRLKEKRMKRDNYYKRYDN